MDKDKSKAKGKPCLRRKPKKIQEENIPEHNHEDVIHRLIDRDVRENLRKKNETASDKAPDHVLQKKISKECLVLSSARLEVIDLDNLNVSADSLSVL